MNYPNNLKKEEKKKSVNYANRGMALEELINETNRYYLENDIAIIYKKPTPIGVVKRDKTDHWKIKEAYFKEQSTLDYNGLYKGKYIEFDAKETKSKTSFPINNIHSHQLEHIKRIINHGGIVFLIIAINNEFYLLKGIDLINFINNEKRKSIPYEYLQEKGFKLKENYLKGIDYLREEIMED